MTIKPPPLHFFFWGGVGGGGYFSAHGNRKGRGLINLQ